MIFCIINILVYLTDFKISKLPNIIYTNIIYTNIMFTLILYTLSWMPDEKEIMLKGKLKFFTNYIEKSIEKIQFKYHLNIFFWNMSIFIDLPLIALGDQENW